MQYLTYNTCSKIDRGFVVFSSVSLCHSIKVTFDGLLWKYLVWWQHSKFTSAISKCWGFCWCISMFFSICLGKKNAEAIRFFGILKKYISKNLKYIFLFKKRNVLLNKSYFCLSHDFQTWFHNADHLLYSLFILLLLSHISFWETEHRNNANPSLFI